MQTDKTTPWAMDDTLEEIVNLAWSTFIGSDTVRLEANELRDDVICASIVISGPHSATVVFFVEPALARASTAAVLGMTLDEVADVDVHDVIGEIVNIIGGNLKGVVPDDDAGWRLSLPVVSNAMQTAPGARVVSEVCCLTAGGTFGCQILEHC